MEYKCEMTPRKVNVFIEKTRDGHVMPVTDVDVREVACGLNHTVSKTEIMMMIMLIIKRCMCNGSSP